MKVIQFSSLYPIHCLDILKITRDSDKPRYIISPESDRKNFFGIVKETDQPLKKKYFFWCDLPLLAVFIIFVLFCHQVVHFIHLVFRQTWELNSHPRTVAQTVSPQRSPLDQGASPRINHFKMVFYTGEILYKSADKFILISSDL
jgi:hypothetical protein